MLTIIWSFQNNLSLMFPFLTLTHRDSQKRTFRKRLIYREKEVASLLLVHLGMISCLCCAELLGCV